MALTDRVRVPLIARIDRKTGEMTVTKWGEVSAEEFAEPYLQACITTAILQKIDPITYIESLLRPKEEKGL